jgi:septal ring factor EnvC (AmiA/AmiB activator)
MKKRRLLGKAAGFGLVLAFISLPLLSGCTAMASKDQLRMLDETRKAAESAEADLEACKQRRAELERQLAQKKQDLAEWQNILRSVQQGLGQ